MPFTSAGADIAMKRDPASGRFTFDWDATGNPYYADDNTHRVMSLVIERRPTPGFPGWWADSTGERGSVLYAIKNVRRSTPSEVEAAVLDAARKAVDEGWVTDVTAKAHLRPAHRANVEIRWTNPGGQPQVAMVPLRAF